MAEASVEPEGTAPARARVDDRVRKNRILGLSVAAAVFVVDQAVKWVVIFVLQLPARQTLDLLPFFRLRWQKNPGVSMGFLSAESEIGRWLLVAMTGAISLFILAWLWREKRRDDTLALALVLGGALGNIVDRVRLGSVVDFADLHFGETVHPFLIFNVGDAAITIGILLLLVRALMTRDRKAPEEDK
jgi:signal peptidase II